MFMTPWVQRLLIANVVVFFLTGGSPRLGYELAFVPGLALQRPWTIITYMFVHAGTTHLLFNMIGLFFFGPRLETRLGGRGFLTLYVVAGIGGALFSFAFERNVPIVGASGAVYGIIAGFAHFWPRDKIYIWAILPVEAWLLAVFMVLASLWSGITGGGNVAHFAHLGGLALGYGYVRWRDVQTAVRKKRWQQGGDAPKSRARASSPRSSTSARTKMGRGRPLDRWQKIPKDKLHRINRDEVDALLDKIGAKGIESLTPEERKFLDRMSTNEDWN